MNSGLKNRWIKRFGWMFGLLGAGLTVWILFSIFNAADRVLLEFDVVQDEDMILFSTFGEPPQFAFWLEDPETGKRRTVFATHRTAANDWLGKSDCPDSLPLWSSLFKTKTAAELGVDTISGATPKEGHFRIRTEVPSKSEWICWVEVNLAGDFNATYPAEDMMNGYVDTHFNGQPALVYKGTLKAVLGSSWKVELVGMAVSGVPVDEMPEAISGITTAPHIFKEIKINVIKPPIRLIPTLEKNNGNRDE